MKTVFSVLIVCIFAADANAFVPQEFADPHEYFPVQSTVVESAAPVSSTCCDCVANRRGISLRDMWDREHPDGTQHGHIAYPSGGMYYYRRPYNASHYRQHRMRLQASLESTDAVETRFHEGFQYVAPKENHLFRSQIRSADPERDRVDSPTESGVLEFADWQRHKAAKLAWNKDVKSKQTEKGTPAQLSSHAK